MDFFSHLIIGVLTGLFALKTFPPEYIMLSGIMAILPDADIFLLPLHRLRRKYPYLSHRGASHSYIIAMITASIVAWIFYIEFGGWFPMYWLVGFLFYGLHVSLDLLTTSKIPALYPLSKKEYRISAERAVNPLLMFCSFLIIWYFINLHNSSAKFIIFYNLRNMLFVIYWLYLSYRLSTKLWVQMRLPENFKFIPGVLPLCYNIYGNVTISNINSYSLTKRIQFSRFKKQILEYQVDTNSYHMEFLEKAKEISQSYHFFSKWEALIPIIKESKDTITVILMLAESYNKGSAYFLKVEFDNKSKEILSKYDGFNFIDRVEKKIKE